MWLLFEFYLSTDIDNIIGILCEFQGFLTQNPAALVETDDIFDVSDTP